MRQRGTTFSELLLVVAIITVLAGLIVVPSYRAYKAARAPGDTAQTLAEDLALLERTAKNGHRDEGSSLIIVSDDPLVYRCYSGRPANVDSNSSLGAMLAERRFPGVALTGPIRPSTPLLFASNGSAQYLSAGVIVSQHTTIAFSLVQRPGTRTAQVDLNLLTGAVSLP